MPVNAFSLILASAFVLLLTFDVVLCDPEGPSDLYSLCLVLMMLSLCFYPWLWVVSFTTPASDSGKVCTFAGFVCSLSVEWNIIYEMKKKVNFSFFWSLCGPLPT